MTGSLLILERPADSDLERSPGNRAACLSVSDRLAPSLPSHIGGRFVCRKPLGLLNGATEKQTKGVVPSVGGAAPREGGEAAASIFISRAVFRRATINSVSQSVGAAFDATGAATSDRGPSSDGRAAQAGCTPAGEGIL
jgi:hypothetical protein